MTATSHRADGGGGLGLLAHGIGIFVLYSLYGILQEKIMKGTYGENEERFTSSPLLVFFNRLFSCTTGAFMLLSLRMRSPSHQPVPGQSILSLLMPASPIYAYFLVSIFNFLSTTCQYEALKHVSFTTQSLAKTVKMVPVLVVGKCVYGKSHKTREWIGASLVVLGGATYLWFGGEESEGKEGADGWEGFLGAALLLGYLFFDGLTSTTQERVFGKSKDAGASGGMNPFTANSPILDQMVWVNFFACAISFITLVFSHFSSPTSSVGTSLLLIIKYPLSVGGSIILLSLTSCLGLVVLLSTISNFGALMSSTIMTVRQFLGILINAGIFGNLGKIGGAGWLGVGWVGSGVWIKMDKRFDDPKPTSGGEGQREIRSHGRSYSREDTRSHARITSRNLRDMEEEKFLPDLPEVSKPKPGGPFKQYGIPVLVPLILSITESLKTTIAQQATWGEQLATLSGTVGSCPDSHVETSQFPTLDSTPKTGLVTFPRSGNSYIRSLLEKTTGFRTSSIYCDPALRKTFLGECDRTEKWLIKTHYPVLTGDVIEDYWRQWDQTVHLVRNPIDAIYSYWNFRHAPKNEAGERDHSWHSENDFIPLSQWTQISGFADQWIQHTNYWDDAPIATHVMRYEDLRSNTLTEMLGLLAFLLPQEYRPTLPNLSCSLFNPNGTDSNQPYYSRKSPAFSAWNKFDPKLREMILRKTRYGWCKYGYDRLVEEDIGVKPEDAIDCASVRMEDRSRVRGADEEVEDEDKRRH
ncbi:UAA-domain-containing protein [Atractiella rhizophila]|nr:UAA-domain-containing protein [Atractiella rhizophila]